MRTGVSYEVRTRDEYWARAECTAVTDGGFFLTYKRWTDPLPAEGRATEPRLVERTDHVKWREVEFVRAYVD